MKVIARLASVLFLLIAGALAQTSTPDIPQFTYTISLGDAPSHLLHVQMRIPGGSDTRVVRMPVWNALYQVRDFAQYVQAISAADLNGRPIPVERSETSAWRISGAQSGAVLSYQIYADNPGSFGAEVNAHHAFLNLAQILLYEPGQGRRSRTEVHFERLPPDWTVDSVLRRSGAGDGQHVLYADSYDELVDSPVEIGKLREVSFQDGRTQYRIVIDAASADYDAALVESSVRRIVRAETDWMKDQPCARYVFIYHFPRSQGGGGMEHACSAAIDVPAERMRSGQMSAFDAVTAHEFFHQWNVKRIRPQSLEPVDYTKEQDTRALWFSEGVTSTVEDIVLLRSGLITSQEYLRRLSNSIDGLQERPAHKTQSAEESSLQAWFEKYPFYKRPDRSISYYSKGEILGVMLDLAIRNATGRNRSLRDVFLWMNENYAKKGQFFKDSEGVRVAVEAVTGKDFRGFFDRYVVGTEEIPYNEFLNVVGLRILEERVAVANPGFVASRNFDAAATVLTVERGSEAERAGVKAGDTILEVDGKTSVSDALVSLRPGDTLRVRLRSLGRDRELKFKAGTRDVIHYAIVDVEHPTDAQLKIRAEWLSTTPMSSAAAAPSMTEARP